MGDEATANVRRIGLCLDPLDLLFFRDGRPFDAATRVYGGLPMPRTMAGALRTAMLAGAGLPPAALRLDPENSSTTREIVARQLGAPAWILDAQIRGPWLALREDESGPIAPLLPVPATLFRSERERAWSRAVPGPMNLPGWREKDTYPLWHRGETDAKYPGGYLTLEGITRFLQGGEPEDAEWYRNEDLFGYDVRTGIGIDPGTLTAADGQIYGIQFLALRKAVAESRDSSRPRVVLYVELEFPTTPADDVRDHLSGPFPLGGEGRYVVAKPVDAVGWPTVDAGEDRALWLLATPGLFGGREGGPADRPDGIKPPAQVRAAASNPPHAVSGWDIAMNGPKPTRFAVPAGAVYYIEGAFRPGSHSLCADPESVAEGWGFALRGVWQDGGC
jgi:CRISPR-associated protein Cmr3